MSRPVVTDDANATLRGKVYLWRYEAGSSRAYSGWHLTLEPVAADSLLAVLQRMRSSDSLRKRTIPTTNPTAEILKVPNNRRAKAINAVALKLIYDPAAEPDLWRLEAQGSAVELEVGSRAFDALIGAITAFQTGEGDFSIGDPRLWFWWYPR